MGSKKKFFLDKQERKWHILTAFHLYSKAMYCAQKAQLVKKVKCDECDHVMERKISDLFEDYNSVGEISILFETVAVFEPELYERIKALDTTVAIVHVIEYLTGEKIKAEEVGQEGIIPKMKVVDPKNHPKAVVDAIQMKDIKDGKKIVVTKTMPKDKPNGRQ